MVIRCSWANQNSLAKKYHDEEWGVPCHQDQKLFEMLTLEIFQAGLNWNLILQKRPAFQQAFAQFNIQKVSHFTDDDINQLMQNKEIVRNRRKIEATINNAQVIQHLSTSFDKYLWSFIDFKPIVHHYQNYHKIPSKTNLSIKISKQMKKDGFIFTGPVTIQSLIQAIGMVNDHEENCFKKAKVGQNAKNGYAVRKQLNELWRIDSEAFEFNETSVSFLFDDVESFQLV